MINQNALKDISLTTLFPYGMTSVNAVEVANCILSQCTIYCIENRLYDING